jgi:ATP:cob(I)alamin adenosyltransferase
LPFLIRHLHSKDPPFNNQWVRLKAKLHLLQKSGEYAVFWHGRAATACAELGPEGAPAFPAMTEAMNEPHAASDVGAALSRMFPNSAPVLTNILATGNVTARCRAADALVKEIEDRHISFKDWATPGATLNSAALDVARTICRRAERHCCGLHDAEQLKNPQIIVYLNRLSDALWVLARWVETQAGARGSTTGSLV